MGQSSLGRAQEVCTSKPPSPAHLSAQDTINTRQLTWIHQPGLQGIGNNQFVLPVLCSGSKYFYLDGLHNLQNSNYIYRKTFFWFCLLVWFHILIFFNFYPVTNISALGWGSICLCLWPKLWPWEGLDLAHSINSQLGNKIQTYMIYLMCLILKTYENLIISKAAIYEVRFSNTGTKILILRWMLIELKKPNGFHYTCK